VHIVTIVEASKSLLKVNVSYRTDTFDMPACDGLPDRSCPKKVNNRTVKHTQGELMLCPSCDAARFPRQTPPEKSVKKTAQATSEHKSLTTQHTVCTNGKVLDTACQVNNATARARNMSVSSVEEDCCPCCLFTVDAQSECIKCDVCKKSVHQNCTGMNLDVYNVLKPLARDSCWVCSQCRMDIRTFHVAVAKLNEQLADTRLCIQKLTDQVDELKIISNSVNANTKPTTVSAVAAANSITTTTAVANQNQHNTSLLAEIHKTVHDITKRKRNVVISGLAEPRFPTDEENTKSDEATFHELCEAHLSVKPALAPARCKRLGKYNDSSPRRLLVHLTSEESVSSLIAAAKCLRNSDDPHIARNVYINRDLSPLEAKEAYEKRQRRRTARLNQQQSGRTTPPVLSAEVRDEGSRVARSQESSRSVACATAATSVSSATSAATSTTHKIPHAAPQYQPNYEGTLIPTDRCTATDCSSFQ